MFSKEQLAAQGSFWQQLGDFMGNLSLDRFVFETQRRTLPGRSIDRAMDPKNLRAIEKQLEPHLIMLSGAPVKAEVWLRQGRFLEDAGLNPVFTGGKSLQEILKPMAAAVNFKDLFTREGRANLRTSRINLLRQHLIARAIDKFPENFSGRRTDSGSACHSGDARRRQEGCSRVGWLCLRPPAFPT